MKRFLAALAIFLTASGVALAADMPVKARPIVPVVSWTGFYVNGGLGYGLWAADTKTVNPVTGACVLCVDQTQGGRGWFGTVGVGYDYQFNNWIVGGVFADFDV